MFETDSGDPGNSPQGICGLGNLLGVFPDILAGWRKFAEELEPGSHVASGIPSHGQLT